MDIGWGELLVIIIVGLLVVGPEKLPSYARKTAKFVRNFQKVTTGLTGQITKAMDLDDDEGGKSSNFKKDLMDVKKSLEKDVADLKATLDVQAKAVSKTMEEGTKEASEALEQNAREISSTLSAGAGELQAALNDQARAVSETVESGVNDAASALNESAAVVTGAVDEGAVAIEPPKDQPISTPVMQSEPVPAPPAQEADIN
jgi:sec-independent protein translocase protein TatB